MSDILRSNWIRYDDRPKNQKFICPHCKKTSFCQAVVGETGNKVNICDYAYCPRCGKVVDPQRKATT